MKRKEILDEATKCVCKDREDAYGNPEDSFKRIANLWNVFLGDRIEPALDGEDVALMMALLKIGRITTGKPKMDNYVDLAGYAACAGEIGLSAIVEACDSKISPESVHNAAVNDRETCIRVDNMSPEMSPVEKLVNSALFNALVRANMDRWLSDEKKD